jgi:hypothetical protein
MFHFKPVEDPDMPEPTELTSTTAVKLFDAIDRCMAAAGAGRYRAFNLVTELDKIGLEVRPKPTPPPAEDPRG